MVRTLARHAQVGWLSIGALRVVRRAILPILVCGPVALSWAHEEVIPVYMEPLHRLVFENAPVRVLDVQLQPGDTSLYHLHEDPIFYVALEISEIDAQIQGAGWERTRVAEWHTGAVAHDLGHAERPLIHRIRNVGDETFRLIAVTNSGPPTPLAGHEGDTELPGDTEIADEWFRQARVTMAPGSDPQHLRSPFPVVVVQVSPGRADVVVSDAATRPLTDPGNFSYVEPGRVFDMRNTGNVPVTLVVIEAR